MRKLLWILAWVFPALLTLSSCSTDNGDDPISDGYSYVINISNLSMDLTDKYDINVTVSVGNFYQKSFTVKSRDEIPGYIMWAKSFDEFTSLAVDLSLVPKTNVSMDDETSYQITYKLETSIYKGENPVSTEEKLFDETNAGANWKAKGTIQYFQKINDIL